MAPRRGPRISLRLSAGLAVGLLCGAVAVLAATGTFNGGAKHARLSAEQRRHNAEIAHMQAARRAAIRAAKKAAARARKSVGPGPMERHGNLPHDSYGRAVDIGLRQLGVPYVWGGATPKQGFDGSGLVTYVYGKLGVSLPHYSVAQYHYRNSVYVRRSQLEPGDLVFFNQLGDVGIYVGNNEFIHPPHTGAVVRIDSLSGLYSKEYTGATRILS